MGVSNNQWVCLMNTIILGLKSGGAMAPPALPLPPALLTWLQSTHKTPLDCSGVWGKKVSNNAMYNNYKHVNWGKPERASHLRVGWRFSLLWTRPSFRIIIHLNSLFIILFPTFRVCTCNSYSIQHKYHFYCWVSACSGSPHNTLHFD